MEGVADHVKINGVLLLQRRVFLEQLKIFSKLHEVTINPSLRPLESLVIPSILSKRIGAEEHKRLADEIELLLLSLLDASGTLSSCCSVEEFVVIMTRVVKVDHRLLCLHIISECMTYACAVNFVEIGGLRLLRRWLRIAEEENGVEELTFNLIACKKLPFNEKIVRDCEIGKAIRKLLKFRGNGSGDIAKMHAEVKSVMDSWTSQLKAGAKLNASQSLELQTTPEDSAWTEAYLKSLASCTKKVNVVLPTPPAPPPEPVAVAEVKVPSSAPASVSMDVEKPRRIENSTVLSLLQKQQKSREAELKVPSEAPSTAKKIASFATDSIDSLVGAAATSAILNIAPTSTVPSASTASTFPRKERDRRGVELMAEGARKFLAANVKLAGSSDGTNGTISASSSGKLPPPPLKSAIKRRAGELASDSAAVAGTNAGSDEAPSKRQKLSVKWVDQAVAGGSLRQVFTFEVEKIKSSVANYKTHRDLVKREKQLEKDAHVHKIGDAMQPTGDWVRPAKLVFSIELQEYAPPPAESPEREIQIKRLSHVLEARYIDDSLIPLEPDFPPSGSIEPTISGLEIVQIPWCSEGEVEVIEDSVEVEQDEELAASLQVLPECVRDLDPETLKLLVSDEENIQAILNSDGTVNLHAVNLLRRGELILPSQMRSSLQSLQTYDPLAMDAYEPAPVFRTRFEPTFNHEVQFHQPRDRFHFGVNEFHDRAPLISFNRSDSFAPNEISFEPSFHTHSRELHRELPPISRDYPIDAGFPMETNQALPFKPVEAVPRLAATVLGNLPVLSGLSGIFSSTSDSSSSNSRSNSHREPDSSSSSLSNADVAKGGRRFPTTKAATPCKFFNTVKGCQFGDKCAFGHFQEESAPLGRSVRRSNDAGSDSLSKSNR